MGAGCALNKTQGGFFAHFVIKSAPDSNPKAVWGVPSCSDIGSGSLNVPVNSTGGVGVLDASSDE